MPSMIVRMRWALLLTLSFAGCGTGVEPDASEVEPPTGEVSSATSLASPLCTGLSVTTTPVNGTGPDPANITLHGTGNCGGPTEYVFQEQAPGATTFTNLNTAWSTSTTYSWPTAGRAPGRYNFRLVVRTAGSSEVWNRTGINLGDAIYNLGTGCWKVTLNATRNYFDTPNDPIFLGASPTCTNTVPHFRFFVQHPGGGVYDELAAYGALSGFNWSRPTGWPSGQYTFVVYARGQFDTWAAFESADSEVGLFGNVCTTTTLSATMNGPTVNLTSTSNCAGNADYRFFVRAPGATAWTEFRTWAASPTASFQTSKSGLHQFQVWTRVHGNLSNYEGWASATATAP